MISFKYYLSCQLSMEGEVLDANIIGIENQQDSECECDTGGPFECPNDCNECGGPFECP